MTSILQVANTSNFSQDISLSSNPQEQKQELQPEQETCSICLYGAENSRLCKVSHRTTEFFHKFHLNCINPWLSLGNRNCPNCREPIKAIHIATNPSAVSEDEEQPLIQQEHVIEIRDPSISQSLIQGFQQAPCIARIAMIISGTVCVGGLVVAGWFYQQLISHFADLTNHH